MVFFRRTVSLSAVGLATLLPHVGGIKALPWMKGDSSEVSQAVVPEETSEVRQTNGFLLKLASNREPDLSNVTTNLHHGSHYCMDLSVGGGAVVRGAKQRYGTGTYLVAHPEDQPEPVGLIALHATLEQLLGSCEPRSERVGHSAWFADVGVGASEMAARASSMGCSVLVLDPDAADSRAVEMTRCVNDPDDPFVVLASTVAGTSDANVSLGAPGSMGMDEDAEKAETLSLEANTTEPQAMAGASVPSLVQHKHRAMPSHNAAATAALRAHEKMLTGSARGIALDTLFMKEVGSEGLALDASAEWTEGDVAMLKITPHGCCGRNATVEALKGSWSLLKSGRVKCLVTEMNFDPNSTSELLGLFTELQVMGFQLMHTGPLDSPELEITDMGAYPLFRTDVAQLHELHDTLGKIRAFDERTGYRVYGDGLSLDRKGRYFDFTNTIVAYQGHHLPKRVELKEKGKLRFRDGMWWPEMKPNTE